MPELPSQPSPSVKHSNNLLQKALKLNLLLVVFLIPVWFLPFMQSSLQYQKQILLIVLTFAGFFIWFARMRTKQHVGVTTSLLDIGILGFLVSALLSNIFSLSPYGSFWGFPLDPGDSVLTLAFFAVLYFLLVQTIKNLQQLVPLLTVLVFSGAVAVLVGFLSIYNIVSLSALTSVGTANGLALFIASLLPLALVLTLISHSSFRVLLGGISLLLFSFLIVMSFLDAWIVLMAGLLILMLLSIRSIVKRRSMSISWVSSVSFLFVIVLFFTVFDVRLPFAPSLPIEVSPSRSAEVQIVGGVFSEGPVRALFGSGPGTFIYDYARFHSAELNKTIFWGTRFSSGSSGILDLTATHGIVGFFSLFLLIGSAVILFLRRFRKNILSRQEDEFEAKSQYRFSQMLGLGIFASFGAVLTGFAVYPTSFTQWFLFWILLAAISIWIGRKLYRFHIQSNPFFTLLSSLLFSMLVVFGVGFLFVVGQKYTAEVQYRQGVDAFQRGDIDLALVKVAKAAARNGSVDLYWRNMAQLYLAKANQTSGDLSIPPEQRDEQVKIQIQRAADHIQRAVARAPENVENYTVQGFMYRSIISVPGAERFAIESYKKAAELEPASPFAWGELGRVSLLHAEQLSRQGAPEQVRQEKLTEALLYLETAILLKEDYAPAHYLVAIAYNQQGEIEQAITKLEETKQVAPQDIGLAFQLGVIYWQRGEHTKAQSELERARSINPNYSNARYILGLVYDSQGEKERAQREFEKVLELNPENEEVRQILLTLAAGQSILPNITSNAVPIEEIPPEISGELIGNEEIEQEQEE